MTALARAREWFIAPPEPFVVPEPPVSPGELAPPPSLVAASPLVAPAPLASAAVLGRPGEAEPVAAALALALRRASRAKAAAVVVVGALAPRPGGEGGSGAARRLAARLEAYGLEVHARGRLAWVALDPGDPQLVAAARHLALVAAPMVLAVTAPRDVAIDAALAAHPLLAVVTPDPDGPLARLAAAGLDGMPVAFVAPLRRGPARALAHAGIRPVASLRRLVTSRGDRASTLSPYRPVTQHSPEGGS